MPLISENIKLVSINELVDKIPSGELSSTQFTQLESSLAFSRGEMIKLKNNIIGQLDKYDTLPTELTGLAEKVKSTTPEQMSSILFAGGVSYQKFSADKFDLSLESLTRFSLNLQAFYTLLAGGCEIIRNALAISQSIGKFSVKDIDITSIAEDILGAIGGTFEEIKELATKSVTALVEEITAAANEAYEAIYDIIDKLSNININDILSIPEKAIEAFNTIMDATISELKSLTSATIAEAVNIISGCGDNLKNSTKATIENIENSLNNLDTSLPDVNTVSINKLKSQFTRQVARVKGMVDERTLKQQELAMAAALKKFGENNPDATEAEKANFANQQAAQAGEQRNNRVNMATNCLRESITQAPNIMNDMTRRGNTEEINSVAAGRNKANKEEIVKKSADHLEKNGIYSADFFYPSRNASNLSREINNLHPVVAQRFAKAIRHFLDNYYVLKKNGKEIPGYDIQINSGFRSLQEQATLQKTNTLAVKDSWHSYGCAIDLNLYDRKRGIVLTQSSGLYRQYYVGFLREVFNKYGLNNPLDGSTRSGIIDYIHFIPTELFGRRIAPIKTALIDDTARNGYNEEVVSRYLTA